MKSPLEMAPHARALVRPIFFIALALLSGGESAHVISDRDEAHHVTERILQRQNGKKHSHKDVQELRDEFRSIQQKHFPQHDPKKRKSSISLSKEHARNMREATLRNEPGGTKTSEC